MKATLMYVANRIWLILAIYSVSLVAAAATFALLEDKSFGDGLWWATVTALTIGYGDLSPVTTAGRIAGVFFGHFWIFVIIPMIIVLLALAFLDRIERLVEIGLAAVLLYLLVCLVLDMAAEREGINDLYGAADDSLRMRSIIRVGICRIRPIDALVDRLDLRFIDFPLR